MATAYTGMKACKPADYEKAAEMINPGGWHGHTLGLARLKPLKSVDLEESVWGFCIRVQFAQRLANRTVHSIESISNNAGVDVTTIPGTEPEKPGEWENLRRYHRYILPFVYEKRYKELRLSL